MRYKGKYRLKTEYDLVTKTFPRDLNGQFSDVDVYIDCYNGVKIYYYGHGVLQTYVPSLYRGRKILGEIDELKNGHTIYSVCNNQDTQYIDKNGENLPIKQTFHGDVVFDIEETDSELLFKFNARHMEDLEPILRPKTSGANISPFSTRNLPKTAYKIPESELLTYKEVCGKLPKENRILLPKYTQAFLKSLASKRNSWDKIKADMALKGLRGKEYIHSIGKWNDYIKYLQGEIDGSK